MWNVLWRYTLCGVFVWNMSDIYGSNSAWLCKAIAIATTTTSTIAIECCYNATSQERTGSLLALSPFPSEEESSSIHYSLVVVVSSLCSMANNICHASTTTSICLFLKTSGGHWPELSGQCSPQLLSTTISAILDLRAYSPHHTKRQ